MTSMTSDRNKGQIFLGLNFSPSPYQRQKYFQTVNHTEEVNLRSFSVRLQVHPLHLPLRGPSSTVHNAPKIPFNSLKRNDFLTVEKLKFELDQLMCRRLIAASSPHMQIPSPLSSSHRVARLSFSPSTRRCWLGRPPPRCPLTGNRHTR